IRALYATGFFRDIELRRDGATLVIVVQERPSIESVEIKGNKDIKTDDLDRRAVRHRLLPRHRTAPRWRYAGDRRPGAPVDRERRNQGQQGHQDRRPRSARCTPPASSATSNCAAMALRW